MPHFQDYTQATKKSSTSTMLTRIPDPADYGVSIRTGFLPPELPLEALPNPYYAPWEAIAKNLNGYILSRRLRGVVESMRILSTDQLITMPEWRRANSLLSFIAHAYIWGGDETLSVVPPSISIPFLATCSHLELPPVATYAGVALWNYKLLFPAEPDNLDLSNLATLQTFTGSMDESWFYLISVAIEAAAGPLIGLMLDAMKAARAGRIHEVTDCLKAFAASLDDLGALLKRMYENCDSHVFYHRIRPYLAGSKNMKDAGLPDGVCFDIGYGTPVDREYVQFSGGSNAQSSVIQFFDLVLGIEHKATGEVPSLQETLGAPSDNFIHDMRQYMPGPHRRFLLHIAAVANIRDFVLATQTDVELVVAYDACLAMLRRLRDNHIEMVTRYIIIPSRDARNKKSTAQDDSKKPANLATANAKSGTSEKKDLKGTGGTALIPFLRQARDETGSPAVGEWARMLMSGTKKEKDAWGFARERTFRSLGERNGGVEIKGLSGTWTDEDTGGGICHW